MCISVHFTADVWHFWLPVFNCFQFSISIFNCTSMFPSIVIGKDVQEIKGRLCSALPEAAAGSL